MLRILVISLFVANLVLLGFQDSKPPPPQEPAVVTRAVEDDSIPTIYLFSEMMENRDLMAGNRQCFSLGPFHSVEDKDETRNRLTELTINISERQTQALVEKGYWVYMPPYESLLAANRALLSLQALGLKDIGIIYDGEWQYAISLGYFLRQSNALRRKKALEDRGHMPLIRVKRQAEPRYWLEYEQEIGSDLIALDFRDRPNDFMQRPLPCPEQEVTDKPSINPLEDIDEIIASLEIDENSEASSAADSLEEETPAPPGEDVQAETESGGETPPVDDNEPAGERGDEAQDDQASENDAESDDGSGSGEA